MSSFDILLDIGVCVLRAGQKSGQSTKDSRPSANIAW